MKLAQFILHQEGMELSDNPDPVAPLAVHGGCCGIVDDQKRIHNLILIDIYELCL